MGRGGGGGGGLGGGIGSLFSKTLSQGEGYGKWAQMAADAVEAAGGSPQAWFAVIEMVQNATRFGKAPFDIRVTKRGDTITIKVSDRGQGFDLSKYAGKTTMAAGLDSGTHGRGIPAMLAAGKLTASRSGGKFTVTLRTRVKKGEPDLDALLNQFGGF